MVGDVVVVRGTAGDGSHVRVVVAVGEPDGLVEEELEIRVDCLQPRDLRVFVARQHHELVAVGLVLRRPRRPVQVRLAVEVRHRLTGDTCGRRTERADVRTRGVSDNSAPVVDDDPRARQDRAPPGIHHAQNQKVRAVVQPPRVDDEPALSPDRSLPAAPEATATDGQHDLARCIRDSADREGHGARDRLVIRPHDHGPRRPRRPRPPLSGRHGRYRWSSGARERDRIAGRSRIEKSAVGGSSAADSCRRAGARRAFQCLPPVPCLSPVTFGMKVNPGLPGCDCLAAASF